MMLSSKKLLFTCVLFFCLFSYSFALTVIDEFHPTYGSYYSNGDDRFNLHDTELIHLSLIDDDVFLLRHTVYIENGGSFIIDPGVSLYLVDYIKIDARNTGSTLSIVGHCCPVGYHDFV